MLARSVVEFGGAVEWCCTVVRLSRFSSSEDIRHLTHMHAYAHSTRAPQAGPNTNGSQFFLCTVEVSAETTDRRRLPTTCFPHRTRHATQQHPAQSSTDLHTTHPHSRPPRPPGWTAATSCLARWWRGWTWSTRSKSGRRRDGAVGGIAVGLHQTRGARACCLMLPSPCPSLSCLPSLTHALPTPQTLQLPGRPPRQAAGALHHRRVRGAVSGR